MLSTRKKHPHVRGEDAPSYSGTEMMPETPPRAWGRLFIATIKASDIRNTPTCVGKTQSGCRQKAVHRKHPHVRGEDHGAGGQYQLCWETPPRAWGRRANSAPACSPHRNTPTCVGKTERLSMPSMQNRKHPHVRGEDHLWYESYANRRETPPRAWGRRFQPSSNFRSFRNTPTCVGKTLRDY